MTVTGTTNNSYLLYCTGNLGQGSCNSAFCCDWAGSYRNGIYEYRMYVVMEILR